MKLNRHRAIAPKLLKRQPSRIRRHRKASDLVETLDDLTNSDLATPLRYNMADADQFLAASLFTAVHGNDDVART
jgi:hypothetical protein